jgi:hypothetical protein
VSLYVVSAHTQAGLLAEALSLTISRHVSHSIRPGLTSDLASDPTPLTAPQNLRNVSTRLSRTSAFSRDLPFSQSPCMSHKITARPRYEVSLSGPADDPVVHVSAPRLSAYFSPDSQKPHIFQWTSNCCYVRSEQVHQSETFLKRSLQVCIWSRAARLIGTNKRGERGSADLSKVKRYAYS